MNPALYQMYIDSIQQQGAQREGMMDQNIMGEPDETGMMPQQGRMQEEEQMPMQPQRAAPNKDPKMGNAAREATAPRNPIKQGASNALESTRASLEMTEDQRRRALGEALMSMSANFMKSDNPTVLGSIGESFEPGLQAWKAANAEHRAINLAGLNRQDTLEEREWKHKMDLENLAINKAKLARLKNAQNLTGIPQEYASYEALKARYGEDHPSVKAAARALQIKIDAQEQLTKNRVKYEEIADKGKSTPLGKLQLERNDILAGYMPSTGRTVEISPEQQNALLGQYDLQIQKSVSDNDTRKRALFASNMDKTIEQINVDDLTQYAGLVGTWNKKKEQGKAIFGKESEAYDRYQESLTAAKTLAKQMRQFYGDSIQRDAVKALEDMTNPATWKNNPALAKRQFEKIKGILQAETGTYKGALESTREHKGSKAAGHDMVTIRDNDTGETKRVTREEAEKLVRKE